MEWFRTTEQQLMDAVAAGDRGPWERAMDAQRIITTEEGAAHIIDFRKFEPLVWTRMAEE